VDCFTQSVIGWKNAQEISPRVIPGRANGSRAKRGRMTGSARARNPYSRSWLWIPGSALRLPRNDGVGWDGADSTQQSNSEETYDSSIPRRDASGFCKNFRPEKSEGAGNAGCQLHPQPRVRSDKAHELVTTGSDGFTRHSPRNGFTAYFALSSVTTLFDTVACACYRRLDANDWGVRTTRLRRPRQHHSSSALPASTASRPALMTCATPLLSRPDGANQ
jgi:hypothetical protein